MKNEGFHISDLLKEPIIMREEGSGTRKEIKEFLRHQNFDINDLNGNQEKVVLEDKIVTVENYYYTINKYFPTYLRTIY